MDDVHIDTKVWSRFRNFYLNPPDRGNQENYNRTPHPTDMKYIMARGPPVHIIKTGGVLTTESLGLENCPDFQVGPTKNTFAICMISHRYQSQK